MWRAAITGGAVALVIGLSAPAAACSCEGGFSTLQQAFSSGLERAEVVFRGRAVSTSRENPTRHQQDYEFRVAESFKGPVLKERTIAAETFSNCPTTFELGVDYLVFSKRREKGGPLTTGFCSRTQRTAEATLELEWLRNRKPISAAVAVRQQTVSCAECTVNSVAAALVCGGTDCAPLAAKDAAAAIAAAKPFWSYARREPGKINAPVFGLSKEGSRPFILRSGFPRFRCSTQVTQQWCASFKLSGDPTERPTVECVGPTDAKMPCDELATRISKWSAASSTSTLSCEWKREDGADCDFSAPPPLLSLKQPTAPGLLCRPLRISGWECARVPDAASEPGPDPR